ncbi:hypothetical protein [Streptomyces herbicida]|uniref:hypothetical protein n=1 Tax=Streptomyces herbicida TaxID=3065675 RepID=UPI00292F96B1|nr:hypothetical protein [Streptomyces sp. NEAU-HV9]
MGSGTDVDDGTHWWAPAPTSMTLTPPVSSAEGSLDTAASGGPVPHAEPPDRSVTPDS